MATPSFVTGSGWFGIGSAAFNCTVTGPNVYLIVGVASSNGGVTAVTYGGQAMTKIGNYAPYGELSFWYLRNPPSGSNNIVQTGSVDGAIHALVYQGIRLASPFDAIGSANSASSTTTPSVTVGSQGGSLVISGSYHEQRAGANLSPLDGQTERVETAATGGTGNWGFMTGDEQGAASVVTGSWGTPAAAHVATIATNAHGVPSGSQIVFIVFIAARRWQEFLKDLKRGLVPPNQLRRRYQELVTI